MENASKALIIAGAILLAIVIISLGLVVVNNTRGVSDNANLSEQEIQSFNSKFVAYEGKNVSASRVNTLIQQVIATNKSLYDEGNSNFVAIAFKPINYNSATSYAWITLGKSNTNDNYVLKYLRNEKATLDDGSSTVITGSTQIAYDSETTQSATIPFPALSVPTGKTYQVKIYYKNGLVSWITAIQE